MIPFLYRFHYLIVFIILTFIILFSWIYTILGFGMEMSAWKMTLMNYKKNSMSIDATIMFEGNNINIMYVIMHFFMCQNVYIFSHVNLHSLNVSKDIFRG